MRLTSLNKLEVEYMLLSERMSQNLALITSPRVQSPEAGSLINVHCPTNLKVLTFY